MATFKRLEECEYRLIIVPVELGAGYPEATEEDLAAAGYTKVGKFPHHSCKFTDGFEAGYAAAKAGK